MKHDDLEILFNSLGRSLFRDKERVTIDLLGSAALILGYRCWTHASDVDARWDPQDSFVLCPLIAELGEKRKHPKGARWMNADIADIVVEEGEWARTVEYGFLKVRIPTAAFMMSILVQALHACQPGDTQYPPFGKTAAQCKALAQSQGWSKDDIVVQVAPFLARGILPACDEWLNRIFASSIVSPKRPEMFGSAENCGSLITRG